MKKLLAILMVLFVSACGQVAPETGTQLGVVAGCTALTVGSCFDESVLQTVMPGISAENCVSKVTDAISTKKVTIDAGMLVNLKAPTCQDTFKGFKFTK